MNIELLPITYEDKSVLSNLHHYDSSEFDGHALNYHGLYSCFNRNVGKRGENDGEIGLF